MLKISIHTLLEAEEAVAALFERVFRQSPILYTDEETLVTEVSVYCPRPAAWTPTRRRRLLAGIQRIRSAGLPVGRGNLTVKRLRHEDWAESWKRHFRPLEVGPALLVKPSWSRRRPRSGQAVVVLDPGLSFGTGQHPTTAFCLEQVVACRRPGEPVSLLDIGTGSGILAIAAAKLGYAPVHAFDFDPAAVRIAQENARLNAVDRSIRIRRQDLTRLPLHCARQYDVICANLLDDLLIGQFARILARLRPSGRLVLAGILTRQFPQVRAAYEAAGLQLVAEKADKEWYSGSFAFFSVARAK